MKSVLIWVALIAAQPVFADSSMDLARALRKMSRVSRFSQVSLSGRGCFDDEPTPSVHCQLLKPSEMKCALGKHDQDEDSGRVGNVGDSRWFRFSTSCIACGTPFKVEGLLQYSRFVIANQADHGGNSDDPMMAFSKEVFPMAWSPTTEALELACPDANLENDVSNALAQIDFGDYTYGMKLSDFSSAKSEVEDCAEVTSELPTPDDLTMLWTKNESASQDSAQTSAPSPVSFLVTRADERGRLPGLAFIASYTSDQRAEAEKSGLSELGLPVSAASSSDPNPRERVTQLFFKGEVPKPAAIARSIETALTRGNDPFFAQPAVVHSAAWTVSYSCGRDPNSDRPWIFRVMDAQGSTRDYTWSCQAAGLKDLPGLNSRPKAWGVTLQPRP